MSKSNRKHQICTGTKVPINPENMDCHSRTFLTRLQQSMADFDYALLEFLPAQIRKRHAHYHLDLLISKTHYNALLSVLSGAESLHFIRTRMHKYAQEIELVFNDLSHLSITMRTRLQFRNLFWTDSESIFSGTRFFNGFKVPSLPKSFEYHLLKSLAEKTDFPHDYSEYFSHCTFEERSAIFAGIVPKYKFVINMLDDLMSYKSKNAKLVHQSLAKMKNNKGIHALERYTSQLSVWVKAWLFGRWNYFYQSGTSLSTHNTVSEFLIQKAYLSAG